MVDRPVLLYARNNFAQNVCFSLKSVFPEFFQHLMCQPLTSFHLLCDNFHLRIHLNALFLSDSFPTNKWLVILYSAYSQKSYFIGRRGVINLYACLCTFVRMPPPGVMGQPPRPAPAVVPSEASERPATVKTEDIQDMGDDSDDEGWAGAQEEVDYNVKLKFDESDEEPEPIQTTSSEKKSKDESSLSSKVLLIMPLLWLFIF